MKNLAISALALIAVAGTAHAAVEGIPFEQVRAQHEESLILTSPIAGIENHLWFDYRINVTEAQKELASDLRRVSDAEDYRDAWDEYGHELRHERTHYIKEMAERGYRTPSVTIERGY
ncbi:hypothetical protein GRI89_03625 [Altererythrobacter salegens]|uniref:DUF4148 domain-containing protein n=1 Tax=Croceibacterium salegens TaxID=1737568 RepID=A0A6I4SRM9_9SPHN|nr:hypothetical protein [Croceibacterium salegens]MXO58631.1 hypothetical protein [Croceibacterium salegens]